MPKADVNAVPLPDNVDMLSAAALGCRFMTAYHSLVDEGKICPGEWVAVFGSGGLGLAAVQVAKVFQELRLLGSIGCPPPAIGS